MLRQSKLKSVALTIAVNIILSSGVYASDKVQDKPEQKRSPFKLVPFIFSSESMGNALGAAGIWVGAGQPQAAIFSAGLTTDKGTWIGFLSANNYVLSADSRLLISGQIYASEYKQADYYFGQSASNSSLESGSIKANSSEQKHQLSLRYILPLGAGKAQPIRAALIPDKKITGHTPLDSGVSSIELRPFYQSRFLSELDKPMPISEFSSASEIFALETRFRWDNRDNSNNPSQGSLSEFTVTTDFGSKSYPSWWKWELNQSYFWDLGQWEGVIDKQVFAFNFYSSDIPSWNQTDVINGETVYHRPPEFAASTLGGLYRLRSYSSGRYTDRSALSYSMEYRMNPEWQPLGSLPVFDWYRIPWWQWVGFADVGRVADRYNLIDLHTDMKWSVGVGMRFQVEGIVARTEIASGSEDAASFRFMINQPF